MFLPIVAASILAPTGKVLDVERAGTGMSVPFTEILNPSQEMTVAAWVRPSLSPEAGPFHFIVSKNFGGTGYALLFIGDGNEFRFQFEANDTIHYWISGETLNAGWWHVAGVRTRDTVSLYLNGLKVAEKPVANAWVQNQRPLLIGASPWGSCTGLIDDVQIWNIARSESQIASSMAHPPTGKEKGLIGFWNFDRTSGRQVYDLSHHTRPGLLIGTTKVKALPSGTRESRRR